MGSPPVLPLPSHLDHSGLLLSPLNVTYFPPVSLLLFFPFFLVFALRSPITAFFATNNGSLGYYKTSREIVVCFLKGALHYLLVTHIIILCLIFVLLFYT